VSDIKPLNWTTKHSHSCHSCPYDYQALYMCSRSNEGAWTGCRQGRTMRSVWVLRHANQVQYLEP